MTKYLLLGWKKAIDVWIQETCEPHKDVEDPNTKFRNVWYHYCHWIESEIDKGDMLVEFRPFADEYANSNIKSKLNSYLIYRSPK